MGYIIFNKTELDKINFSEVNEDSIDTIRYSIDGELTFVNWEGRETPSFISHLSTGTIYDKDSVMQILRTNEWNKINELI